MNQFFNDALSYFNTEKTYELPNTFYGAGGTRLNAEFKFIGTVGNNTKFQFREIHGGWTVTLAPAQLGSVMDKGRRN